LKKDVKEEEENEEKLNGKPNLAEALRLFLKEQHSCSEVHNKT
jgi:hypothetical protein